VLPPHDELGRLPPGIHVAPWAEVESRCGGTPWRHRLLRGLREALISLKTAGCSVAYIDGSFVTSKEEPGDFDACWDEHGVDPDLLDPVLLDFTNKRARQKAKYGGELFPSCSPATQEGLSFLEFFQIDKKTGDPKGIIAVDLGGLQP